LMLQTLHQQMRTGKPIYGMHRGTVGFLMNEFSTTDLKTRLAAARESLIHLDPAGRAGWRRRNRSGPSAGPSARGP
jgi:NAD kinase